MIYKKSKFSVMLVVFISLALLTFVLGSYANNQIQKKLVKTNFNYLHSLQQSKVIELKNWFENLSKLLVSLSIQSDLQNSFEAFSTNFYTLQDHIQLQQNQLKGILLQDLQNNYVSKIHPKVATFAPRDSLEQLLPKSQNALIAQYLYTVQANQKIVFDSPYEKIHQKYHPIFSHYISAYNIYDMFMIDLKGNLVYTNIKEKDFATNVLTGVFQNSGLSKVFQKAIKTPKGTVVFEDFAIYEPSFNSAASFIATPIYIDSKLIGVFAFQISVEYLNKIIHFQNDYKSAGLYITGENYLIGFDSILRSDLRSTNDKETTSEVGIKKLYSPILEKAKTNNFKQGEMISQDYDKQEVLGVFTTFEVFPKNSWIMITKIQTKEVFRELRETINNIKIISTTLLLIVGSFVLIYIYNIISKLHKNEIELQKFNLDLQNTNLFVKTLFDNIPLPIFYKNAQGVYLGINQEFEKVFGYAKHEVIGKTVFDITSEQLANKYNDEDQKLLSNPYTDQVYEYSVKNKLTGKLHDVIFYKKVYFDQYGKVQGIIGSIVDITQTKKDKQKLIEYSEKLKVLNDNLEHEVKMQVQKNIKKELQLAENSKLAAMGMMIGNIIHQWKQPLSSISTIASLIQIKLDIGSKIDDLELLDHMESIINTVQRLGQITDTFRNFLKEKKTLSTIVLQNRVQEALVISGTILKDKKIELRTDLQLQNPIEVTIVANELTEVLINIINNASDAIQDNNIEDSWVCLEISKNDNYAIVTVEDNAGGIPEDLLPNIFDEYFTTKSDDRGTGLGLYMSKKIVVESFKGKLEVSNTPYGAKFSLFIPLIQ